MAKQRSGKSKPRAARRAAPDAPASPKPKKAAPAPKSASQPTPKEQPAPTPAAPAVEAMPFLPSDAAAFGQNLAYVMANVQKLMLGMLAPRGPSESTDPLNIGGAFSALFQGLAANPPQFLASQIAFAQAYLELLQRMEARLRGEKPDPLVTPAPSDRRFRHPDWSESPFFDFLKQFYLLASGWMEKTAASVEGLDPATRLRVIFYVKQFADALSPSNFILTNPEVLRETMSSNGANLVRGIDQFRADIERGGGKLAISQTTHNFVIGRDVATAPGKVVFRNELIELLQFEPQTGTAYEIPLLIFPPWINKFYILDLQPTNSFVRWAVAQGYTVFVVSWINPGPKQRTKTFEDYMRGGIFAALDAVEKATGQKQANVIGYCIAGTLLGATLAYIAASGEYAGRITSATFFAAQNDFSEAGELQVFIDEHQLNALEAQMNEAGGVLEGSNMAMTFNMLRANDLIWPFVIGNYLMGKAPVPFDLLFWNSDTTRMPVALHMFYLREFYLKNAFAQGQLKVGGRKLDAKKVKTPLYFQAAKDDHIAPAVSVYKGTKLFGGPVTFMLAGSGHIAGVVNPPSAQKYQHWTNDALPATFAEWRAGAVEHPGSWWPSWDKWLAPRSGPRIPAPKPGDGDLKVLGDAPGTYVHIKAGSMAKKENA
jgi:polyhydroxyalkanoate synthase